MNPREPVGHEMRFGAAADHRDPSAARTWHIAAPAAHTALCGAAVTTVVGVPAADTAADTAAGPPRRPDYRDDDAPPCGACLDVYRRQLDATARTSTAPTAAVIPSRTAPCG